MHRILLLTILVFLLPSSLFAKELNLICENKLTEKYIEEFDDLDEKWCKKNPERLGKFLSSCTKQKLRIRQMEVCKLLRDKGLINWSHQKFINIPNLNSKKGIAYKYTIPCWEYGSNTPVLELNYSIGNETMVLSSKEKDRYFTIDLNNLRAGFEDKKDYLCKIN